MGCIAPRKIALLGLKDHMKQPASEELINEELTFPSLVYKVKNVPENLNLFISDTDLSHVTGWCFE